MKWVKCIYNGQDFYYDNITLGKIYQVVEQKYDHYISIINDGGITSQVTPTINDVIWFEDATAEVMVNERDNKLKELGI
jgi:hypothetical protein